MQPIDLTLALKATDGDFELLREVVQRACHTIKGTLRLFGNVPAKVFAEQLEEMGNSGVLEQASETFESLKHELSTLRVQLVDAMKDPKLR